MLVLSCAFSLDRDAFICKPQLSVQVVCPVYKRCPGPPFTHSRWNKTSLISVKCLWIFHVPPYASGSLVILSGASPGKVPLLLPVASCRWPHSQAWLAISTNWKESLSVWNQIKCSTSWMQGAKTYEHRRNSCHLSAVRAAPKLRALTLPVPASSCLGLCIAPVAPVEAFSVETTVLSDWGQSAVCVCAGEVVWPI